MVLRVNRNPRAEEKGWFMQLELLAIANECGIHANHVVFVVGRDVEIEPPRRARRPR